MKGISIKIGIFLLCCITSAMEATAMSIPDPDSYSVGSIKGNANVNAMGAACYNFSFEVPDGGAMTPQLGLAYSSHNGKYGIAGYGFDLTGISVITSGGKDIFHDGIFEGAHYDASSTLYLDGKRLILKSGSLAGGNAVYDVEGDPFSSVTSVGKFDTLYVTRDSVPLHQNPDASVEYRYFNTYNPQITVSFVVHTPDGSSYEYGTTPESLISFAEGNDALCAAWYLTKATDRYGNSIEYSYIKDSGNRIYISSIDYGFTYDVNGSRLRNNNYSITFYYYDLETTIPFYYVGKHRIETRKVLSEVYCKKGFHLLRDYKLTYSTVIDNVTSSFTRLISVTEKNAAGESLSPVVFNWNGIEQANITVANISSTMDTSFSGNYTNLDINQFLSTDVNNDGLTDLIRIDWKNESSSRDFGKITIQIANRNENGDITFSNSMSQEYSPRYNGQYSSTYCKFLPPADIDGDGMNEIVKYTYYDSSNNGIVVYEIFKYDSSVDSSFGSFNLNTRSVPVVHITDCNNDGKEDILFLETSRIAYRYTLHVISNQNHSSCLLNINSQPKELFSGDFNNDGLADLIVITDEGYSIFSQYSNYGYDFRLLSTGTNMSYHDFIKQGDFNGDGLLDFILFSNDNNIDKYQIAFNTGNGRFNLSSAKPLSRKITSATSQNSPTLRFVSVYDVDGDGRSDIATIQKGYAQKITNPSIYEQRTIFKLTSFIDSGDSQEIYTFESPFKSDDYLQENFIFLSDFDGDGITELSNYGSILNQLHSNNHPNQIHIYKNSSLSPCTGKLESVTDGFGVKTSFIYDALSNQDVYLPGIGNYPVNSYTLPISVVKEKKISVGNTVYSDETYSYRDLKIHLLGKGSLGFAGITKADNILGNIENTEVEEWNTMFWIPAKSISEIIQGSETATTETTYSINEFDRGKNYFAFVSENKVTDFDGNIVTTTSSYDVYKGVISRQKVTSGTNMYKQTDYSDYVQKSGVWLPQTVTSKQKHEDDNTTYQIANHYSYDNYGNITELIEASGTSKQLATNSAYDRFGNVLSKTSVKAGKTITEFFEYDSDHLNVTKTYQNPYMGATLYRYDTSGNVIEERDSISPNHVLVTRHEYDNWGRRTRTINPDNTYVEYNLEWNTGTGYRTIETPCNAPAITTVYDALGRKVSENTTGRNGVYIFSITTYNPKGQVASITNQEGNLTIGTTYTYDNRGRKTREESTSGGFTSYSYENRTVSTSNGTRNVTRTYDAWGNITASSDNIATVEYTYGSNGLPAYISSNGHEVSMEYDITGNRTMLNDPDAGSTAYSYTVDGILSSQSDARGISTSFSYDNNARLLQKNSSGVAHLYGYCSNGYGKFLPSNKVVQGDSVKYEYDLQRRITKETRKFGARTYEKSYSYDALGNLSSISYPGGLNVTYSYDSNGFVESIYANSSLIYHLDSYDGLTETTIGANGMKLKDTYDSYGFLINKEIKKSNNAILAVGLTYNRQTGNIASRSIYRPLGLIYGGGIQLNGSDMGETQSTTSGGIINDPIGPPHNTREDKDQYVYDSMDRLVSVSNNNSLVMAMDYDDCGNIIYKTGVGEYTYDDTYKPHAVMEVENRDGSAGSVNAFATYHPNGKLETLTMGSLELVNTYRADDEKWQSQLIRNDSIIRTVFYFDDYEEIAENGCTYSQYFLDNNVIVIKRNGSP